MSGKPRYQECFTNCPGGICARPQKQHPIINKSKPTAKSANPAIKSVPQKSSKPEEKH